MLYALIAGEQFAEEATGLVMMHLRRYAFVLAAAAGLLAAGCGSTPSSSAPVVPKAITIGTLYAGSGAYATSSQPELAGLKFWASQVNAQALKGVNLKLAKGGALGLVGPNGSGKTTLINIISGIYRPNAGKVELQGVDVTGKPPHHLSHHGVNRTFQVPKPFGSLTVRQNIDVARMYSRRSQRKTDDILAFVGLQMLAGRPADSLNTAQQKLLDLGRALATDPHLLLIDELGAGLGPADLDLVAAKLNALRQEGITMLIVEHLMGFLGKVTEEVVVMNAGAEIFVGKLETAAKDPKVVEVFLGG
ncbi:MAG: ATP-binding cassette domain-containing protein [Thermaerobacter sp.]|nr:ATP-binding cassette domain-containing protein [Thermaerobacter sp.]